VRQGGSYVPSDPYGSAAAGGGGGGEGEEGSGTSRRYVMRRGEIRELAGTVFADAGEEFATLAAVKQRLEAFKARWGGRQWCGGRRWWEAVVAGGWWEAAAACC
jgi:GC-rich sequence DNA-binding factor